MRGHHLARVGKVPDQLKRDMAKHPQGEVRSRMHLAEENVANLLAYLLRFMAEGEL